jgi:hypothetical protein
MLETAMFISRKQGQALLVSFTLSCLTACHASHSAPNATLVVIDDVEAFDHSLSPVTPLRLSKAEWDQLTAGPCGGNDFLPYELIVSGSGAVESAHLLPYTGSCNFTNDPPNPPPAVAAHLSEANSLVRGQRFIPWVISGRPSRVLFHTTLPIAPPERFGASRSLPVPIDDSSVVISLERHGCEGQCPSYSITIDGDGTVTYAGYAYVKVPGTQRTHITEAAVIQLLDRFREANFGSALPAYIGAYDGGDNILKVRIDGKLYQVVDDSGLRVGLPTAILTLEQAVDDTAQSRRWVTGE